LQLQLLALEREIALLLAAPDRDLDLAPHRPPDLAGDLGRVLALDVLAVHLDEHVPGQDPRLVRRRAVYGGGDDDPLVLVLQLNPDADVPAR
jgi:hypothetical protein